MGLLSPPLTSPDITMDLKQSARLHHDLNVTLRYDETVASYDISNDFRGYSEYDIRTASGDDEEMEFDYSPMDDDRDYNNDVSGDWEAQSYRMVGSFNQWNESGDHFLQLGRPCPAVHSRHQQHGHGRNFVIDVNPGATYRVVYDQKA